MPTAAFLLALPVGVQSQEVSLSLEDAVSAVRRDGAAVRVARARARAAEAARSGTSSYLWPTLALEAGAVRSSDPVAAFGGRLRQGRFGEVDFDPARLNDPAPLTDWSGAVAVGWAPVDPASAAARGAARLDAEAAALGAEWVERASAFEVEALYVSAVGAERRLAAVHAALEAAEATHRRVGLRVAQGLGTDADLLRARAAAEGARARRIEAERTLTDARADLAVALGWDDGRVPVPSDTAFDAPPAVGRDPAGRADLGASAASVAAAEARVAQARRTRLPTARVFARIETHSEDPFSGARNDWSAGFVVGVPLFTGFSTRSRAGAAEATADAAREDHVARVRAARAEVDQTVRAVEAARLGAAAADASSAAADEAARLTRLRYEEGLATTADLLASEAEAAQAASNAVDARLYVRLASARLDFLTDITTGEPTR